MIYAIQIGEKKAEINCADNMSIEELEVVKSTLNKLVDTTIDKRKRQMQNKLPLTADINSLYPELSVRARNVLKRSGCDTIGDVLNCTLTDLKNMRNMGKNSFEEIQKRFRVYGNFREEGGDEE